MLDIQNKSDEIKKILEALKYADLDELDNDEDEFDDKVYFPFKAHYDGVVGRNSGASKGVLIFKDLGFVIKIPFENYGGDQMCGADLSENGWDYCEQEANYYSDFQNAGFGKMFLETIYLEDVNNHPIYIQELATVLKNKYKSDEGFAHTDADVEKVRTISNQNDYSYIDLEWEADIYLLYGEEFYKSFMNFVMDYDITDLRDANIGYVGEYPVIFDYAGFYD